MEQTKKLLKDSAPMRWLVLFMVSALMFATYWFQDFYSGLKPLMESQLGMTSTDFSTMISFTTLANLFGMIMVGGVILDKWGIKLTTFVFGAVAALGGVLSALGAADVFSSDPGTRLFIMAAGRLVFGVGLEITCVLITRTIIKWFKGYELALALAVNMGLGRLGSAIGTAISPEIAHMSGHVSAAVTLAATLIGIGFILIMIYLFFDAKIDKQIKKAGEGQIVEEEEPFRFDDLKKLFTNKSFLLIAGVCVAFYSAVFPFMQYAPDLLINQYGFSYQLESNSNEKLEQLIVDPGTDAQDKMMYQTILDKRMERKSYQSELKNLIDQYRDVSAEKAELLSEDIARVDARYTATSQELIEMEESLSGVTTFTNVMIFVILFLFGLLFPILPSKIKNKGGKYASLALLTGLFALFIYGFKDVFALWIVNGPKAASFLPMGTILFTPIFGRMVDTKGKAASIMLLGSALLIFSHTVFAFIPSVILCYVALFCLGIAFSLVPAAMWPSVARIVPERRLGSAYAGMFTIQNYGLFLFFKGIGTVLDWANPKVVTDIQSTRQLMLDAGVNVEQIPDHIQFLKDAGNIDPYNYTIPVLLFIACGVAAIFLSLQLRKTSDKMGYNLEKSTNHS